jgi:hypothetical protein
MDEMIQFHIYGLIEHVGHDVDAGKIVKNEIPSVHLDVEPRPVIITTTTTTPPPKENSQTQEYQTSVHHSTLSTASPTQPAAEINFNSIISTETTQQQTVLKQMLDNITSSPTATMTETTSSSIPSLEVNGLISDVTSIITPVTATSASVEHTCGFAFIPDDEDVDPPPCTYLPMGRKDFVACTMILGGWKVRLAELPWMVRFI